MNEIEILRRAIQLKKLELERSASDEQYYVLRRDIKWAIFGLNIALSMFDILDAVTTEEDREGTFRRELTELLTRHDAEILLTDAGEDEYASKITVEMGDDYFDL